MSFLVDTNVVSELRRPRPDPRVVRWWDGVSGDALYLSVLTLGELRQGVARLQRRDEQAAGVIGRWLDGLAEQFHRQVLPVTSAVADRWGELNAARPLPVVDGLLAATALVHDLTLVTRNVADVADTGVIVLNPWDA